jgi:predicted DNA-binding transcriptional regulator YafY
MAIPTARARGKKTKDDVKDAARKVPILLELITLMQGGTPRKAEEFASHFGVTVRTIRRYMNDLSDAGVPYNYDREAGGYRIRGDYFLPPFQLALSEAITLGLLCEKVAGKAGIPNLRPAASALSKIEAHLPHALRSEVRDLCRKIEIHTARSEPEGGSLDVHTRVRDALRTQTALRCRYEAAKVGAEAEEFEFEPYALFFSVRAWYVIGRHAKRRALRSLKLVRFESVQATDRRYTIPASFSLEKHLGNAWRMIRADEDHDVELLFDASFAQGISETLWHPTQQSEEHEDGSVTLTFRVSGLDEICWWVLSMGPHVRVVKPQSLRERVRLLARDTAAVHA